jgi:hypothetical protein
MNRTDLDAFLAEVLGDHLEKFRADLERMVAAKALPPFTPPGVWVAGRHPAGSVVRHRNGLFSARRDTNDEPPTDAWLPLLVGIASVGFDWQDDRHMVLRVELSDGTTVETTRDFTVPIARGWWVADTEYVEGDRVLRFGDWQCAKPCKGIDPNGADNDGHWLKVNGKGNRAASFRLDDDGTMYEGERKIGTIKPLVANLLRDLVPA